MSEDPDPLRAGDPGSIDQVYDHIATHFASTREYPWPEVTEFVETRSGETGLDIGCGNGRHTEVVAGVVDRTLGIDVSRGLLEEAVERRSDRGFEAEFVQGDAVRLPVASDSIDLALYVATIHHLGTRTARVESLNELARVLDTAGTGLVSAWSTAHDRFDGEAGFDTTVDWTLPGGETVPRFYHIYDPEEFEAEVRSSELRLAAFEVSSGNCYATVEPER